MKNKNKNKWKPSLYVRKDLLTRNTPVVPLDGHTVSPPHCEQFLHLFKNLPTKFFKKEKGNKIRRGPCWRKKVAGGVYNQNILCAAMKFSNLTLQHSRDRLKFANYFYSFQKTIGHLPSE